MEKQRRLVSGTLSEIFGEKALNLDKFSLSVGYRKVAQQTWESDQLKDHQKQVLQAYADGVNDFLEGIGYFHDEITAFYYPPEFYALGIANEKRVEPWHPVDSLALLRLMNFHLSHNWIHDLLRDIIANLEKGELKDLAEEMISFSDKHSFNLTTILDEDDMKKSGLFDPTPLNERYNNKQKYTADDRSKSGKKAERMTVQKGTVVSKNNSDSEKVVHDYEFDELKIQEID